MNYKVLIAAFLAASIVSAADSGLQEPPLGWARYGGATVGDGECDMGVDGAMRTAGQLNLSLLCDAETLNVAALRHAFLATPYWGKRIRFGAWMKVADVSGELDGAGAGVFIVHTTDEGDVYHSMSDAPLTGWTDWEYREMVIDVPEIGQWLNIGFQLRGKGQAWFRNPEFEIVPESVPLNTGGTLQ